MITTILIVFGFALALSMAVGPALKDAALALTRALPASTSAVTSATAIDTGPRTKLALYEGGELTLTAPALTTAQLPDNKLMIYSIIHSDNADLSGPVTLISALITQTGAGGAGAAGDNKKFRLPSDVKRYVGLTITPSGSGTGDASGVSANLQMAV